MNIYNITFVFVFLCVFLQGIQSYTFFKDQNIAVPIQQITQSTDGADIILRSLNGESELIRCPSGTQLNKAKMECEFINNIQSNVNQLKLDHCSTDVLFPNPENCAKYISCGQAGVFDMDCGKHQLFNPKINACDYASNEVCCEYREVDPDHLIP